MARLLVAIAAYAAADDAPVFAGPVAALCAAIASVTEVR